MLPFKSQVNCPLGSGEEAKNKFMIGFTTGMILANFIYKSPDASYQVSSQVASLFRRSSKRKIDF